MWYDERNTNEERIQMKKIACVLLVLCMCCMGVVGCGGKETKEEIQIPSLDAELQTGGNTLEYSVYTEVTKGDKKSLEIELCYTNEILTEGQTKAITNILDVYLSSDYEDMTVTIMQENPSYDYVEFEYNDSEFERTK